MEISKTKKIYNFITFFIILSLLISFPVSLWEGNWLNAFLTALTFFIILAIWRIQKKYNFKVPLELQLIVLIFIYSGVFLGGVQDFYYRFWWFDSLLHTLSGFGLGFLGFLILYSFYKTGKITASPFFIAVFSFCFAITLGVIWEIFEFGVDELLGFNMQKARNLELMYGYFDTRLGVLDTMYDLILNTIGALIASIAGYIYLKRGEFFIFDKMVKRIEKHNSHYFKKKQ